MLTFDQVPEPIRRAFAYRAALECLGYDAQTQCYVVNATTALISQLPPRQTITTPEAAGDLAPGVVWLLVTLSKRRRFDQTDIVIVVGALPGELLQRFYPEPATAAYNALDPRQRADERKRWVGLDRLIWLTAQLLDRGIVPNLDAAMAAHSDPGRN